MRCILQPASEALLSETLAWQKAAHDAGHSVMYDSRETAAKLFRLEAGFCAVVEGAPIAYVVFSAVEGDVRVICLVEVHPGFRRLGIAARLLAAAEEHLKHRGAQCIDVTCVSTAGEALCRQLGYHDHQDDYRNRGGLWHVPTFRKYLTDWRPKERHPWD